MPNNSRQNERFKLAIQAIKAGQIFSVQKATQLYNVFHNILQRQLNSTKQCLVINHIKHKLTETEKTTLFQ